MTSLDQIMLPRLPWFVSRSRHHLLAVLPIDVKTFICKLKT